jgi:hypothetical protein
VTEQLDHFLRGFHDIVPAELVSIFSEQELELLISGLPDINVDDWKNNTDYHNYTAASPQIQWFWRAVRTFEKEEQAKLLQFVTGTSKVPLNGFKELEGMNGFSKFNIHRDYGNKDRLPSSHTCFNRKPLPSFLSPTYTNRSPQSALHRHDRRWRVLRLCLNPFHPKTDCTAQPFTTDYLFSFMIARIAGARGVDRTGISTWLARRNE